MKNKKFIVFASDLNSNTGEGTLGRFFLYKIFSRNKNSSIRIITPNQSFLFKGNFNSVHNNKQNNIYHKYLIPLIGAFKLRLFNKETRIIFLNYLPLWNFLLFIFLPSRTLLGPITGSNRKYRIKNFNFFLRNYFFPLFYFLSLRLIKFKFKNVIFSTNLLKNIVEKNIPKKKSTKYLFNFVFNYFDDNFKNKFRFKSKKDLILFYNKNHETKKNNNLNFFINKISKKHKVTVLGDKFNNKNLTNLGYLKKKKLKLILNKTKFIISSNENLMSLFNIEAINSGAFVIYDKKSHKNSINLKSPFLALNFANSSTSSFDKLLKNYKKIKIDKNFYSKVHKEKLKIELFLKRFYFGI